jgi:phenylalanyl-tRNA synthetase alpha chain
VKIYIEELLGSYEESFKSAELNKTLQTQRIDVTIPGCAIPSGHLHPTTQVLDEIVSVFTSLGFHVEEGPEVELDFYNFEALNMPKDHPARDMQDTFYISDDVVLRTHTSSVQVRVMENNAPPLRVIAPGKVYRCDADVTHIPMFHQLEGFMVDRHITMSDLKGVLRGFIHRAFGPDIRLRFRLVFPLPSRARKSTYPALSQRRRMQRLQKCRWLEILGAGMINESSRWRT